MQSHQRAEGEQIVITISKREGDRYQLPLVPNHKQTSNKEIKQFFGINYPVDFYAPGQTGKSLDSPCSGRFVVYFTLLTYYYSTKYTTYSTLYII
jgi:hypothetical protein